MTVMLRVPNKFHTVILAVLALLVLPISGRGNPPACELFDDGDFFIGCNYWSRHAGMYMWSRWSPEIVERELSELAHNGVTVMRVFPLWSDFQPLTGDCEQGGAYRQFLQRNCPLSNYAGVDDEMMERFSWFCDLANRHGIRLVVGVITGWMSGRHFVPSVFEGVNVLSDPLAIMWQTRFVRYFVGRVKDKKAIVAWDLGNECNCLGPSDQPTFYNWMNAIGSAIRLADPSRPVISGMHGLSTMEGARTPIRLNAELTDVLCTHPYMYYVEGCGREAFNSMRAELHPTAESLLYHGLSGKTCFVEEVGNLGTSRTSDARTAAGMRVVLFSAWANDLKGLLWWCNSDQESLSFPPYDLTANERELGLLRSDYSPKPVMMEMKDFQSFRAGLPFARLPQRRTNAVIVVPEKTDGWIAGFGAYLLCKQAGVDPVFAGAEKDLPVSDFYVVCSGEANHSYTYSAQQRIFAKARQGATVLIFYAYDSAFTGLRKETGLEVDYCCRAPTEFDFALPGASRRLICKDDGACHLIAREAEVLSRSDDGNVMFSSFSCGKGCVLLVNAPVDRLTVNRSDTVTGTDLMPYYLFVKKAADVAALKGVVEKFDCPFVGLSEHPESDGNTIVIAINYEPRDMDCPIRLAGTLGPVWRGSVTPEHICLKANEAAVFRVMR